MWRAFIVECSMCILNTVVSRILFPVHANPQSPGHETALPTHDTSEPPKSKILHVETKPWPRSTNSTIMVYRLYLQNIRM